MSNNTGEILKYFENKGYGFIEGDKGDLFFHVGDSPFLNQDLIQVGKKASYTIETDQKKGKDKAINLEII